MRKPLQKIWAGWKKFARGLGRIQVLIILTLLYIIVFVPMGIAYRMIRFFIADRTESTWQVHKKPEIPDQYFRRQG